MFLFLSAQIVFLVSKAGKKKSREGEGEGRKKNGFSYRVRAQSLRKPFVFGNLCVEDAPGSDAHTHTDTHTHTQ